MNRLVFSGLIAISLVLGAARCVGASEISAQVAFSNVEIAAIKAYYRDQASAQPRGQHARPLPPGIAKNLQRGKRLPPGIARQSLPTGLIRVLPKAPDGYERIVVAGKILLVEIATQIIHDVLEDAVLD